MLSIPDELHETDDRPSIHAAGVTVIDYEATTPTLALPVVVTRPTLVFVHEGIKELNSGPDNPTVAARSSDVVAMRSGVHVMSDLLPDGSRYRSTILSIENESLRSVLGAVGPDSAVGSSGVAPVDASLGALAAGLRHRLASTSDRQRQELAVKEVLVSTLLVDRVRRVVAADAARWSTSYEDRLAAVMGRHAYDPLSVPQYASLCAMSVSTFKRRFIEIYGTSPGRWLIERRLTYAAGLLASSQQPVTDVCNQSGFGDLSNFTRSFKKRFQMSPTEFRAHR